MGLFQCYHGNDGTDAIRAWYENQSPEIRAAFRAVTEILDAQPRKQWSKTLYKALGKRAASKCVGLDEILLDDKKAEVPICVRVLAYQGPQETSVTMLFPFDKTVDAKYAVPCATAVSRKSEVQSDWQRAKPFWLIPD
jgi:hypothetical protein